MILVTGCARSGTGWAARLLTELGHETTHERQFNPSRHGPLRRNESSWLAIPYLRQPLVIPWGTTILRVVRNPFDVVRSNLVRRFLNRNDSYDSFVAVNRPDIVDADTHLERVIRYVAGWDAPAIDLPRISFEMEPGRIARVLRRQVRLDVSDSEVRVAIDKIGKVNAGPVTTTPTNEVIASAPGGTDLVARAWELGYAHP